MEVALRYPPYSPSSSILRGYSRISFGGLGTYSPHSTFSPRARLEHFRGNRYPDISARSS